MNAPCKDCPDRHYLCHSHCEKYIAFDKQRKDFLAQRWKEKKRLDDLWQSSRHSKTKRTRPYKDY